MTINSIHIRSTFDAQFQVKFHAHASSSGIEIEKAKCIYKHSGEKARKVNDQHISIELKKTLLLYALGLCGS